MSDVHRINFDSPPDAVPSVVPAPGEAQFRCYPTRADSLAYYTRWYGRRIAVGCGLAATLVMAGLVAMALLGGRDVGGQRVWELAAGAVVGPILVVAIGALTSLAVWHLFAAGSRVTALLLVSPLPYAGVALLFSTWDDVFPWAWKVMLIGLGVLVLPMVVIVVTYYGFGTRLRRRVGLAAMLVLLAALFAARFGRSSAVCGHLGPESALVLAL